MPMTFSRKFSRRHALGLALGAVAMPGVLRGTAHAQGGRVVVGTWGGDYARLLNKNIEQPILIKQGWEVVQDQAGDPERRSKMLAERRLPRGTTDVQGLSALNMFQMHDAGVIDAVGDGVDRALIGREVVLYPGLGWGDNPNYPAPGFALYGMPLPGTIAVSSV